MEGERKQVTVLFADVKGSMNLAEQLDPEQWYRILEGFFHLLADGVHRFEGTVNQYTGDGVMALFGAPIAHEDHGLRACRAALHLRDTLRVFADQVGARHGIQIGVRIGLNSGEVVVGRIGDDLSMDYTALGHVVGLAQRMESLAEAGQICLSEHTARLVEGFFQMRDLGRIPVKGVVDPVGLFSLEALGAFRTRLDRARSRGLSAFVGRDRDIAILEAALERAQSDGGHVVGVMAEAGTGKSRLCTEFLDRCRARGIPVLEGHGVAHGKAIPMLPMLELWRAYYEIADTDTPEATRSKIAGRLLLMDEGYRADLPFIFDLFGVSDPAHPAPAADPEQRQKRLHGVVKRVLHDPMHGAAGTRVLLLEDLHWFDGASDGFLETTVESLPASHDLLLVSFRPEYQARWMQRSYYQHLSLQPLGDDAIRELLHAHLGQDPSVAALPEMILDRTKGNPLFVEEVLQSLVEGGHLTGVRGAYRLTKAVAALDVPASVQAVLASRIDRLSEREKRVLQTASVIGKQFSEALLREVLACVAPVDETALDQAVAALVSAEFLYEAAVWPQVEYSFKHPLTQEVAQRSQLRARQVQVHAAVAQALEEGGGNLDERAAEIAQHWAQAEQTGRAAIWHRRAAVWAGLSDPREALRNWRRVRELAAGVEDENQRMPLSLQACQQLLSFGWRMGGGEDEAASVFAEGRAIAERLDDREALATLLAVYGAVRGFLAGSAFDHVRYTEEALVIVAGSEDPGLRAALGALAMYGHFFAGEGQAMLGWSDRILTDVGSDNQLGKAITGFSARAAAFHGRFSAMHYLGRLEEAREQFEEAERVASDEIEVLSWLLIVSAWLAYTSGSSGSASDHGRRCLDIAEKLDNEFSRAMGYFAIGTTYLIDAQPSAACEALHTCAAIIRGRRTSVEFLPQVLAILAEAHLALGEGTEALAVAREGIDHGRAGGARYAEAHAQLALAQALLASEGDASRADIEAALDRAEELVVAIAGRSLSPRILEVRGRLATALGDVTVAGRALREALGIYRAIGAVGHAERLGREIAS